MFDIGFSELVVIGVVALIVIGPERLPKVARTAGHLLGRLQRYVSNIKSDISREVELDELKKAGEQFKQSLEQTENKITEEVTGTQPALQAMTQTESAPQPDTIVHNPAVVETHFIDSPQAELALEPVSMPQPHVTPESNKPRA
ncbi:twin-arginine translocase subunit TatB [Sulfuriferula sp. AH1]|uniref:Sec-independent protein translocase protein TatB n=1 Tax=Sulfuriferula sp. AH1 TaxID=1985873 RepID=UPI000B3B2EB6|nr:Sec-independent protein translocase protein TatB [Sulfuriferula sp. AH1]ARU31815.1 twin-arginine translocase subunit TatB [Sulfuriferula sp. AH1]